MPRPPPPAEALIAIGQPYSSPSSTTLRGVADLARSCPGTIGTPAAAMRWRAPILEPIASIAEGGGPIQTSPASSQARAKAAFSARNP